MKMAVIGCGLIGGSMALSWKRAGLIDHVIAFGHNPKTLQKALDKGAADEVTTSMEEAVKGADIVVSAVPVEAMESVFRAMAPHLKSNVIVTDVGSTRQTVIEAAKKGLGKMFHRYAPAHPIAGGEMPGVDYASADLFDKKAVISTPTDGMDQDAVNFIEEAWTKAGAKVQRMTPSEHDAIFASVSHLPHVLAYVLVDMIAKESNAQAKLSMAGAGFRDFTRIASSSPEMWRDICLSNREAISNELRRYRAALEKMQTLIDQSDARGMEEVFENAMRNRRGLVFPGK